MKKETQIELLTRKLNELSDEHEALQEELYRYQEEGEMTDAIEFQLTACEIAMGELEIEIEMLRK